MRMLNEWLHGEARGEWLHGEARFSLSPDRESRDSGLGGSADSIGHVTSSTCSGEHRATLVTVTVTVTVRTAGRLTDCTSVLSY